MHRLLRAACHRTQLRLSSFACKTLFADEHRSNKNGFLRCAGGYGDDSDCGDATVISRYVRQRTERLEWRDDNSTDAGSQQRTAVPASGMTNLRRIDMTLGTVLLIVLVLALLGVIPTWPHSKSWGYAPSGTVGLLVVVLVVLLIMGKI